MYREVFLSPQYFREVLKQSSINTPYHWYILYLENVNIIIVVYFFSFIEFIGVTLVNKII